jgi:hypothetical protein
LRKEGERVSDEASTAEATTLREVKAAKNQSLFREVNERIKQVGEKSKAWTYNQEAICECADDSCSERLAVDQAEYEAVRQIPTRFLVFPSEDHVFEDVERVVMKDERYWVVEKIDQAASVATKFDPRRRQRA